MFKGNIKLIYFIHIALLFVGPLVFAQTNIQQFDGITIQPKQIRFGQKIEIALDPIKTNLTLKDDSVYAIMLAYKTGVVKVFDTTMLPSNTIYKARFIIPDSTDVVVFKFLQRSRQATNKGSGYIIKILNKNGQDQIGSFYSLYSIYSNDVISGVKQSIPLSQNYFKKWYEKQNSSKMSFFQKATSLFILKDTISFNNHISSIFNNSNINENQLSILVLYAKSFKWKDVDKLDNLKKQLFPNGSWANRIWYDSLRRINSTEAKLKFINDFQKSNPNDLNKKYPITNDLYLNVASKSDDFNTFSFVVNKLDDNPSYSERLFNIKLDFINQMLKKDTLINECYPIAEKLMRFVDAKLYDFKNRRLAEYHQISYNEFYQTYIKTASVYSYYLFKHNNFDSSAYYAKIGAFFYEWKNPEFNERYLLAIEKIASVDFQLICLEQMISEEGYNAFIKNRFLTLYKYSGKNDGEQKLESLISDKRNKIRNEVKLNLKNEIAPTFVLKNINGIEVNSANLKGKVLLIDFWATWCLPCIGSFPTMQKLVDLNLNNKDVEIFFINTWQNEVDKISVVNDFFKKNHYRFNVLMDLNDKVVNEFKVKGIPTKVVIDKNGIIRFVSLGFYGDDQKAVAELQAMIDLAAMQ